MMLAISVKIQTYVIKGMFLLTHLETLPYVISTINWKFLSAMDRKNIVVVQDLSIIIT
jgi:hypothetical protein